MTATAAFYSLGAALMAVHGRTVTLVGDQLRDELTACVMPNWNGALAGGIDIERIEPVAYLYTTDADLYGVENGKLLEVDRDVYQIVASAADDMGFTKLTLAKR